MVEFDVFAFGDAYGFSGVGVRPDAACDRACVRTHKRVAEGEVAGGAAARVVRPSGPELFAFVSEYGCSLRYAADLRQRGGKGCAWPRRIAYRRRDHKQRKYHQRVPNGKVPHTLLDAGEALVGSLGGGIILPWLRLCRIPG